MAHRSLGLPPSAPGVRLALARARALGIGLVPWFIARLLAERERWLLWLPVGIGLGIGLYFALPAEPPLWLGPLLILLIALLWGRPSGAEAGGEPSWRLPTMLGLTAMAVGLTAASIRTYTVAAPVLERRGAHVLEGQVLLVEDRVRGARLTLGGLVIEGLDRTATPAELRVSLQSAGPAFQPGDRVRLRAFLMPPSPPSEPHGHDFARQAYFLQLGAVGYALGRPELVHRARTRGWSLALPALRQTIATEVAGVVPGAAGAIAVALLTGLRGALPDQIWDQWARAGIAHLLAISGLHLALVAGTLFFSARVAFALAPPLALRLTTKKLAAAIALCGAFGYLLISGATVPTERAFITTALMLLAVMVDRNPFSMRLVASAALVVLLLQPESLLGPSFQMSFAAVVALIAVYETGAARHPAGAGGLDWRLMLYVAGIALTTVVASAATTPFSIYHFSRFPTYGIVTNLIAVPLTAFWIMPLGMLGLLLMPFGLADPCFVLMGYGIGVIIKAASLVASLPGAALALPRPPLGALILTALGGLWLCLWRTSWRRLGLIGIALGLAAMLLDRPPDLLIDARGRVVAVRLDSGRLALSPWQRDRWITDGWLKGAGQAQAAAWPAPGTGGQGGLGCDSEGCLFSRNGRKVALVRRPEALEVDCARADLVLSYPRLERCPQGAPLVGPPEALEVDCARADLVLSYPRLERCPQGAPLIGPQALRAAGGLALWLDAAGIETLTVREVRGDRPWTR